MDDECINWTGFVLNTGYGQVTWKQRKWLVHRKVMAQIYGETAVEGLIVMHTCDNKVCINPAHLRIGTQSDNMIDMRAKGRHRDVNAEKTHCKRGHEFTEENTWMSKTNRRHCRACWAVRAAVKRGSKRASSRRRG